MLEEYMKMILKARVYDVAKESPLDFASSISRKIGNKVWLKREDLSPVRSYKIRGAFNAMRKRLAEQPGQDLFVCAV